jgi:hypothetical protein
LRHFAPFSHLIGRQDERYCYPVSTYPHPFPPEPEAA